MAIQQELAKYCTHIKFDTLPEDVVQHAKLHIMNQICLMVVGPKIFLEDHPDLLQFVKELGGIEESSIVGLSGKYPCLNAVLVNSAIGVTAGFDAIHRGTIIHLPGALFPAAIAVAERQKASGRDLILAIVVGTEIMARVGLALGARNTYALGFHPTSVCAPFGCAVATGKLLGLSEGELAHALSIAGVQAAGSSVWAGAITPFSWRFQIGRSAQSGVLAAMLAQIGCDGVNMIFEDQRGFLAAHSKSPDLKKLTDGLGKSYEIKELTLKKFQIGIYNNTSVEALLDMLEKYKITADDIEEMTVKLPTVVMPLVGYPEYPENQSAARKSTRYVLAVTAIMGDQIAYNVELSGTQNREDPRVIDLFKRIDVAGDPELDKVYPEKKSCILTIRTKDGKQFTQRNDGPFKGDPENPLSQDDVEMLFNRITIPILGKEKASQIISSIKQLDKLGDVSMLVGLLTA